MVVEWCHDGVEVSEVTEVADGYGGECVKHKRELARFRQGNIVLDFTQSPTLGFEWL